MKRTQVLASDDGGDESSPEPQLTKGAAKNRASKQVHQRRHQKKKDIASIGNNERARGSHVVKFPGK